MESQSLDNIKLSFFQRIRKSLYLSNMSDKKVAKYESLPAYLKNDEDVIKAIVNQSPNSINNIPFARAITLIQEKPKLLEEIYSDNKKLEIILTFSDDKKMEHMELIPSKLKKKVIMSLDSKKREVYFQQIIKMFPHDILFIKQNIELLSLKAKEENIAQILSSIYDWDYLREIVVPLSTVTIESNFGQILEVIGTDVDSLKVLLKKVSKANFEKYEQKIEQIIGRAYNNGEIDAQFDTKMMKIFCKEYIELLGEDKIQVLLQYPSQATDILSLSEKKLQFFVKCINNHMQKANTEEWTQIQEDLLYNLKTSDYDEFIESIDIIDETNIDFISSLLQRNGNIYGIKSKEDIERYNELKKTYGDKWIKEDDIEQKKLAVLEKIYGQDITFSKEILFQYGDDIDLMPDSDIKYYVQSIKSILNTNNPALLEQMYNECEEVTFVNKEFVEKSLKNEFFKQYKKTLFKVDQTRLIGDNIYDAGTEFSMIVRCDDKAENYKEKYGGRNTFRRQYFSTSYIRNNMISMFESKLPDVCFGYSDLQDDSLMLSGYKNLGSNAHSGLQTSSLSTRYCMPDTQINKTDHHNEMCFRTVQGGKAKLPDYIVVFKVNDQTFNIKEAKKAQSDLDNIPIVVVDINACLQAEKEKVHTMIEEYKQNKTPEIAQKIAWSIKNNRKTYAKICEWQCARNEETCRKTRNVYRALANNEQEAPGIDETLYSDMRANNFFKDFDLFDIDEYTNSIQSEITTPETEREQSEFEKTKYKIEKIISHEER